MALSDDDTAGSQLYGLTANWRQRIVYADTPHLAQGVFAHGDHAYLAYGFGGLYAIDVTDPDLPVSVSIATLEAGRKPDCLGNG